LRRGFLAAQLGALRLPPALEHLRHAVDHDVEEAADAQADQGRAGGGKVLFDHRDRQMTAPSLKIGRYIATTRPPMTTPRKTMMIGSSRLESAATASSTSRS